MTFLDVWYSRIDVDGLVRMWDAVESKADVRRRHRLIEKAKRRTSLRALAKLCDQVDGEYRIQSAPPLIVRVPVKEHADMRRCCETRWLRYEHTLPVELREVVNRHWFADFARKVVGVGSVGTEAFVLLLMSDTARAATVPPGQGGSGVGPGAVRRRRASTSIRASASSADSV